MPAAGIYSAQGWVRRGKMVQGTKTMTVQTAVRRAAFVGLVSGVYISITPFVIFGLGFYFLSAWPNARQAMRRHRMDRAAAAGIQGMRSNLRPGSVDNFK